MSSTSKGDRTEKPTGRRLKDAREKGQIARTQELTQAVTLASFVAVLGWTGSFALYYLGTVTERALDGLAAGTGDLSIGNLVQQAIAGGQTVAVVSGPVALVIVAMVVASQSLQGGCVFSTEKLPPDWSRLNPVSGLKRLGFSQGGAQLVKALLVASTITWVAWNVISGLLADVPRFGRFSAFDGLALGWSAAERLIWQVVLVLFVLSIADYAFQRWRHTQSLMMTKQEVRDDAKLTEGSHETKSRIRRIQRELTHNRMLADVSRATVVITNPTHYAVALEYNRAELPAPRVLAKGQNLIARRIREEAREHDVPIVENPPVAQALFRGAEVGDFIPPALFDAVAEVIVYLIRLKQVVL